MPLNSRISRAKQNRKFKKAPSIVYDCIATVKLITLMLISSDSDLSTDSTASNAQIIAEMYRSLVVFA